MTLFEELRARGLVHQVAEHEELPLARLLERPQTVYAGFDPTAPSLHVGNLIPLLGLRRFQRAGHRVIALAGGATGMVGDPSGKSEERNLLSAEELAANVAAIKGQLERLIDFRDGRALLVDNLDWTREVRYLDFLREVGKHFTVNSMLRKDSVRGRLEREGAGISYTEFSYMLLQAYDFLHLYREHDCKVQVGGSDQWGNITAGTELIRRKLGGAAYGLTFPLLLNREGAKFGKTAQGAVWLDPARTSPFAFRQFWFNTPDEQVVALLRYFTFLPLEEIEAHAADVAARKNPQAAQRALARAMTELVHGTEEAEKVERAAAALFRKDVDYREVPPEYLEDAFAGAPQVDLPGERLGGEGIAWLDLVVFALRDDAAPDRPVSKSKARRLIAQNALALNGERIADPERRVTPSDLVHDRWLVLRKGKKHTVLVRVVS